MHLNKIDQNFVNMKKFFLIICALICWWQVGSAQQTSKIEPELQHEMSLNNSGEMIKINLVLNEQYDQSEMRAKTNPIFDKKAKRAFVLNELQEFSKAKQSGLMQVLNEYAKGGVVTDVEAFWIVNMISCSATPDAIEALAQHPDIFIIGYDKVENMIPEKSPAQPAPKSTNELAWNVTQVKANEVWELGYTGSGILVAVLDTGVNYNHNDIKDNMWEHPDYPNHGYNFINNNNDPIDREGHGSHCAGTVAGMGASGTQTGMAPDATIMAVKVLSDQGSGSQQALVSGVQFAVNNGADVLSLSLGFDGGGALSQRKTLRDLFVNVLEAGIVASVAAGNDGENLDKFPIPNNVGLPGNCPPPWLHPDQTIRSGLTAVVCVGATDKNDNTAKFSSPGPVTWQEVSGYGDYAYEPGNGLIRPDVGAPGVGIKSLDYATNTGYKNNDGTSMATPCVAGVMALMLSKNPNLSPAEICEILEVTAEPQTPTKNNYSGSGRINALAAVQMVPTGPIHLESYVVDDSKGNNNGKLNPGETVKVSVTLKNTSSSKIDNVNAVLNSSDAWVSISSNTATAASIAAGATVTIENAFEFTLSENAVPKKGVYFKINITSSGEAADPYFSIPVYGAYPLVSQIVVNDASGNDNGILDPGEMAIMDIYLTNFGNEELLATVGKLTSLSSLASVIGGAEKDYGDIFPDFSEFQGFTVSLKTGLEISEIDIPMNISLTDGDGIVYEIPFFYQHPCVARPVATLKNVSSSMALVSWTDMGEGFVYNVFRNGEMLLEAYPFTYVEDDSVDPDMNYCYVITSLCPEGLESGPSNQVCTKPESIEKPAEDNVKVYPNPVTNTLFVEGAALKTISVYNILGQQIEQFSVKEAVTSIDLSSYPANVYILEILNEKGDKINKKVIVSK